MGALLVSIWALGGVAVAARAESVPRREIPAAVQAEVHRLEARFADALAVDCPAELCAPTGCVWVSHAVADQPPAASLPGLGEEAGPGAVQAQAHLTAARCGFAHEPSLSADDAAAIGRRAAARAATPWVTVGVSASALPPRPALPGEDAAAEDAAPVTGAGPVEPLQGPELSRGVWGALLPHLPWWLGIGVGTAALLALLGGLRAMRREAAEHAAMLAEIARAPASPAPAEATEDAAPPPEPGPTEDARARWAGRLASAAGAAGDPALDAVLRGLLRGGELPLLARAVLLFPDALPAVMPGGSDVAAARVALAELLASGDAAALPSEAAALDALDRHALAASLVVQPEAALVRSLRDDFGPAGLAGLIAALPPRPGGLLFALAPSAAQAELVRLLPPSRRAALADALMRSERLDSVEAGWLFEVVRAVQEGRPRPPAPAGLVEVADRGAVIDVAGALSGLLPTLDLAERAAVVGAALSRSGGVAPAWTGAIVVPEHLLALGPEARADVLLGIDAARVGAWLSTLPPSARGAVEAGLPAALRAAIDAAGGAAGPAERRAARAAEARAALARALPPALSLAGVSWVAALAGDGAA